MPAGLVPPRLRSMLPALLVGAALMVGWWNYGWRGLVLALSMVVFWLLLSFSRAARVLRHAGQRPVGQIDSVAMLQARLDHGLQMADVLVLTGSLGRKVNDHDDWMWSDSYGNDLVISFRRGVVVRWSVAHAAARPPSGAPDDPLA